MQPIYPSLGWIAGRLGHVFLTAYNPNGGALIRARSTTDLLEDGIGGGYFLNNGLSVPAAFTVWDDDGTVVGREMLVGVPDTIFIPAGGVSSLASETFTFYIKQHDTREPIQFQATELDSNGNDAPVNISGADVRFLMRAQPHDVAGLIISNDTNTTVIDGPNGIMSYQWQAGDTAVAGTFDAEFRVTFTDLRVKTFPTTADTNNEYIQVFVVPNLGGSLI